MSHPPHIIFIVADSWRGDALGFAGHPAARTPVLDRWVRTEAVGFTRAFCQNPVCTPSRCSFMSGWYPHVRGHRSMFHMLHPDEPCLLRDLVQGGYQVWWGGKNDLLPAQLGHQGHCTTRHQWSPSVRWLNDLPEVAAWRGAIDSDSYYSFLYGRLPLRPGETEFPGNDADAVAGAVEAIRRHPADQPLALYLALSHPHPPYAVAEPWHSLIDRSRLAARLPTPAPGQQGAMLDGIRQRQHLHGWDEARWDEVRAVYLGMCAETDHWLGNIEAQLRASGLWDDALVVVTSDHGDFTGDYGLVEKNQNSFQDCLTRVPLVIKPPARSAVAPRVSEALVELVDLPATMYEVAGLTPRHTHFGRSLMPLVRGACDRHREAVFCEGGRLPGEVCAMEREAVADQQPTGLYWPRLSLQHDDRAHGKAVMVRSERFKYVYRASEEHELYDLAEDPGECRNRIRDPALARELDGLRGQLLDHFVATADVVPWNTDRR